MNALLATITLTGSFPTDRDKLRNVFIETGTGIDREGRSSFWSGGRRFIFNKRGEVVKVLDYIRDGRIANNAGIVVNGT